VEVVVAVEIKRRRTAPPIKRGDILPVVRSLHEALGPRLIAVMAGASAETVESWVRGDTAPSPEIADRLRNAWQAAEMLLEVEHPAVVHGWFNGLNPTLGDRPPAIVVGEDPEAFWIAAREFFAYG
jgi:hypothetical protein